MDDFPENTIISSSEEENDGLLSWPEGKYEESKRIGQHTMSVFSTDNCRRLYFWSTQFLGVLIIILTLVHIFVYRDGFGGRAYPKQEFCWHVFFMTLGFTYLSANGLLVFRVMPLISKPKLKWIHFGLNGGVALCAALGLFFVIDEREILGKAHFTSLHSWMGICAIFLLTMQLLSGVFVYLSPRASPYLRESLMSWHIKIGITIFLLGIGAIITGLKKGKTEAEILLVNFTGAFIIILCFLVLHLLSEQSYKYCFRLK